MEVVLPRIAKPLYKHLEKYWFGELSEKEFTQKFEKLLFQQHQWLADRGIPDSKAAIAIHSALLVLSASGLKTEAGECGIPLEQIELRAIREAASEISKTYNIDEKKVTRVMCRLVAQYLE